VFPYPGPVGSDSQIMVASQCIYQFP
jgi:hypothetical protein